MAAVAVAVGVLGTRDRLVVVGGRERLVLCERVADVARDGASGAVVAALLDPATKLCHARLCWVEDDGCGLGDRVRVDLDDTGAAPPSASARADRR